MNKKGELYSYVSLRDGVESLQKSRSRKPFTRAHLSSREFGNWLWVFTSFPFISSCFLQNLRLACETHHGHPWLSCGRLCGTFGQQDLLWMHWSVLCHFFDLEDIRLLPLQGTLAIRFSPVTEYGWIHFCWWGATYHSPNTEPSPFQFFEVGRLWPVHSSLVTVVATFLVEGRHFICGGRGSIAYVKASECVFTWFLLCPIWMSACSTKQEQELFASCMTRIMADIWAERAPQGLSEDLDTW